MAQHECVSENEQSGNKNGINIAENGESANDKKVEYVHIERQQQHE